MTTKQQNFHKSLIKGLHISRRYAEYYKHNKDEYIELLQEHFNVDSSKDLGIDQLIILVDYMNFKIDELPHFYSCTKAQLTKMITLWNSFADTKTDAALLEFVNKQTKKQYKKLFMLTKSEAQKIIPVLQKMSKV